MNIFFLIFNLLIIDVVRADNCKKIDPLKTYIPKYATGFKILYFSNYKQVTVSNQNYFTYENKSEESCLGGYWVKTPIDKIVMTSTTYLPALEIINEEKSLVAFQGKQYIYSDKFNLDKVNDIQYELNAEELLKLRPNLIMAYNENIANSKKMEMFYRMHLPIVLNLDQFESGPLARAEWLIFISSFYNKEEIAIKFFSKIEKEYLKIKNKNKIKNKKVLVGYIQNGKWVMPGGKSDFAQLVSDAGGELLFSSSTAQTQYLSLEIIKSKLEHVDLWLTNNDWQSESDIKKDSRYNFIKTNNVFNYTNRINKRGANDFWEMGMQRPEKMLADLSDMYKNKAEHLFWYKKL